MGDLNSLSCGRKKSFKRAIANGFVILKPYQVEGDNFEVVNEVQTNAMASSSNINLKKRKKVGKGRKMGTIEKPQRSLHRIIDLMDKNSDTSVKRSKSVDPNSYGECLTLLDEISCLVNSKGIICILYGCENPCQQRK